jgi:hypothetical protein
MIKAVEIKKIGYQGDLGFLKLPDNIEIPNNFKKVNPESKGLVLAYGEVSGHAHAIRDNHQDVEVFYDPKSQKNETGYDEMYILCYKPTIIYHEEHDPIILLPGLWKKWLQKAYNFDNEYEAVLD